MVLQCALVSFQPVEGYDQVRRSAHETDSFVSMGNQMNGRVIGGLNVVRVYGQHIRVFNGPADPEKKSNAGDKNKKAATRWLSRFFFRLLPGGCILAASIATPPMM